MYVVTFMIQWSAIQITTLNQTRHLKIYPILGSVRYAMSQKANFQSMKNKTMSSEKETLKKCPARPKCATQYHKILFQTSIDGILILDYRSGKIININPIIEKILGYSKKNLIDQPLWKVDAFKDIATSKKTFTALQQKKNIRYENVLLYQKNGDHLEVELTSHSYFIDKQHFIQCNIRDMTNSVKIETELKRRLCLEEAMGLIVKEIAQLNAINITQSIKDVLGKLGLFLNAKCAYLLFFEKNKDIIREPTIWCSNKQGPCFNYLKDYSAQLMPKFDREIRSAKTIQIPNVNALTKTWGKEKAVWAKSNIKSLICLPLSLKDKVVGFIGFNSSRTKKEWDKNDLFLLSAFNEILFSTLQRESKQLKINKQAEELEKTLKNTITSIGLTIEKRDPYTAGHQLRTAKLCVAIAKELNLSKEQISHIYFGGLIHESINL